MRIYLARHGETVWNRENRTQGWSDIELNANGRRHAAAIAQALQDVAPSAVYASSLSRAMATAQAIADYHKLEVAIDPDLRELNQGMLDGLTIEELRRDHGAFLKEWAVRPGGLRLPGGESMAEVQERAWGAIERIVAAHSEGTVAVVSHNLTIVSILCRMLGLDLDRFRRLRQDVAAINVLDFGGPLGAAVTRVNDTAHLSAGSRFAAGLAGLGETYRFAASGVPEEDVRRIVAAAGGAGIPDGRYHLLVVRGAAHRERLVAVMHRAQGAASGDAVSRAVAALESAPLVLAVLDRGDDAALEGRLGAAVQSLRIAAHALGYGTAWLAGALCRDDDVAIALEVAAPWRLVALLPLGVAAEAVVPADRLNEAENYTIVS